MQILYIYIADLLKWQEGGLHSEKTNEVVSIIFNLLNIR